MLTKNFHRQYVPGTPGSPAVEGGWVCYTPPQGGSWQHTCQTIPIDLEANTGIAIPPGAQLVYVYDDEGKLVSMYFLVCSSQFVPDDDVPEPVCTYIEPKPEVPEVRSRYDITTMLGWDAGANSVQVIEGDCELAWTMEMVVGAYVGLTEEREAVPDPERIAHGFMFHQRSGVPYFRVVEYGEARSNDMPYSPGDEFVVRRARGRVTYLHAGELLRETFAEFDGPASAGCSLYASGDMIP